MIEYHEQPEPQEDYDDPEPGCSSWGARSRSPPWASTRPMTARERLTMRTPYDESDSEDHEDAFRRRGLGPEEYEFVG